MICLFCVCVFILLLEFVQYFVAFGVVDSSLFGFDVTGFGIVIGYVWCLVCLVGLINLGWVCYMGWIWLLCYGLLVY